MNNQKPQFKSARPRPVLMTPIRRCGSHALRLRLNLSPDFYSPYPLHIIDFMPLVELYGDLNNDWSYFQLVLDLVGLQNATMIKWDGVALDPNKIFAAIKDESHSPHRIAWEMLLQAGEQHQAKVVMDKSLDNVYYEDFLTAREAVLDRVCQFIGIEFLDSMMDVSNSNPLLSDSENQTIVEKVAGSYEVERAMDVELQILKHLKRDAQPTVAIMTYFLMLEVMSVLNIYIRECGSKAS